MAPAAASSRFLLFSSTQCNYITNDISIKLTIIHGTIVKVVVVCTRPQFCMGDAVGGANERGFLVSQREKVE